MDNDTIAAISTPPGAGGIGIIRISGPKTIAVAKKVIHKFPQKLSSKKIYHSWIKVKNNYIDQVVWWFSRSPGSYTGEDTVEICGHGGRQVLGIILHKILDAGARLAGKGEFTKRAFLNGRIDLAQAEAVLDIICAKSNAAVYSACSHLRGRLSTAISDIREELLTVLARIEAEIDFPDDVEDVSRETLEKTICAKIEEIDGILTRSERNRYVKDGVKIVIAGTPNVGKSSLLNAILGEARAIVTEVPGTTRDTIEEDIELNGVLFRIIDTAGIRSPKDKIEKLGIDKTNEKLSTADVLLLVVEANRPMLPEEEKAVKDFGQKTLVVINKIDLGKDEELKEDVEGQGVPFVEISALYGWNIGGLLNKVFSFVFPKSDDISEAACFNMRQIDCLKKARTKLKLCLKSIKMDMPVDFYTIDLRGSIESLGELIGKEISDRVLDIIFSEFCVGK